MTLDELIAKLQKIKSSFNAKECLIPVKLYDYEWQTTVHIERVEWIDEIGCIMIKGEDNA